MEMTEKKPQVAYLTKIKKWFITFYKTPFFWLKIIPLSFFFGLAAFGLYQVVTSAFLYFSEPLSYLDPERLGQLGDFLGGTINPLIGLITIVLLAVSILIQRKELKETSESLKNQNELMRLEQTRAELVPIMEEYHSKLNKKAKKKFEIENDSSEPLSLFFADYESISLTDIYHISTQTDNFAEAMHSRFINHNPNKYNYFSPIWSQLYEIKTLMDEIDKQMRDYIQIAQLKSIERFWFTRYQNALYFCVAVGAISDEEKDQYIRTIQSLRHQFIFE